MKHLKLFEDLQTEFKKYIIYTGSEISYVCCEISKKNINGKSTIIINTIAFDRNNKPHLSGDMVIPPELYQSLKSKIVYQSNDIDDISNMLNILKNTNKYNI